MDEERAQAAVSEATRLIQEYLVQGGTGFDEQALADAIELLDNFT